jgi:hypothetical protein
MPCGASPPSGAGRRRAEETEPPAEAERWRGGPRSRRAAGVGRSLHGHWSSSDRGLPSPETVALRSLPAALGAEPLVRDRRGEPSAALLAGSRRLGLPTGGGVARPILLPTPPCRGAVAVFAPRRESRRHPLVRPELRRRFDLPTARQLRGRSVREIFFIRTPPGGQPAPR